MSTTTIPPPYKYIDRAGQRRQADTTNSSNSTATTPSPYKHINTAANQYLGGDIHHTHLVKGLDIGLLTKTKYELQYNSHHNKNRSVSADNKPATIQPNHHVDSILSALQPTAQKQHVIQQSIHTRYVFDTTYRVALHDIYTPPIRRISNDTNHLGNQQNMLHQPSQQFIDTLYKVCYSNSSGNNKNTITTSAQSGTQSAAANTIDDDSDDDMFGSATDTTTTQHKNIPSTIDTIKQPLFGGTKSVSNNADISKPESVKQLPSKRTYINDSDSDDDYTILQSSRQRNTIPGYTDGNDESKSIFAGTIDYDSDDDSDNTNKPVKKNKLDREFKQVVDVMSSKHDKYKLLLNEKYDTPLSDNSKRSKILNIKR